jgi:hypothetical protein
MIEVTLIKCIKIVWNKYLDHILKCSSTIVRHVVISICFCQELYYDFRFVC